MYQQNRASSRPPTSPATSNVHDRLDVLFEQLKTGLKMVDSEELVALLEELVDRVDR